MFDSLAKEDGHVLPVFIDTLPCYLKEGSVHFGNTGPRPRAAKRQKLPVLLRQARPTRPRPLGPDEFA